MSCKDVQTRVEYAGDDISGKIEILRDKKTKEATLKVDLNEEWALYKGNSVDSISFRQLVMRGNGGGAFPLDIAVDRRSYFLFVTKTSKAILSEKHLPMDGGYNFRDMGGLKNKDGRFVKWGKVFRSDELNHLTKADLTYLGNIPLTTVVDFRSASEIEKAPDKLPKGVSNHLLLSITPGALSGTGFEEMKAYLKAVGAVEVMKSINRSLSTDSAHIEQYRRFFEVLQTDSDIPILFHCTAGKDRTGMAAALFLYSLGVDESVIFADYLESNVYLKDKYAKFNAEHPDLAPMFCVQTEYLRAGLDEIAKNYGSIDAYLKNVLKVDVAKMRENYLY